MDVLIFCIVASERHKGNYNRGLTMIVKNIVCSNNVLTIEKKGKGDLIFFYQNTRIIHSFQVDLISLDKKDQKICMCSNTSAVYTLPQERMCA